MSWTDVDEHLRLNDLHYVTKNEDRSIRLIKEAVKKHFPDVSDESLSEAIDTCMNQIDERDPRQVFVDRLQEELDVNDE